MEYTEEDRVRIRIVEALRDAFPERAGALANLVNRWFARHWRNEPADAPRPDQLCSLCRIERQSVASQATGREWPRRGTLAGGTLGACSDCIRDALALARDPEFPRRDVVRREALRAVQAAGDEEAERFVNLIAGRFPDLVRDHGSCSACAFERDRVRGASAAYCASCLEEMDRRITG